VADFKVLAQRAPLPLPRARKTVSFELHAVEGMTAREIQRWEEECNTTSDDLANDKVEEGAKRKHSFSEISSQTVLAAQPPQDRLSPPSDDPTRDPQVVAELSFGQSQAEMIASRRGNLRFQILPPRVSPYFHAKYGHASNTYNCDKAHP
jgi:hypothetical protein